MIDCYASERHYADHLLPVWTQLPAELRGTAYLPKRCAATIAALKYDGYDAETGAIHRGPDDVLVASWQDEWRALRARPESGVYYLEHGAGQCYQGSPESVGHRSYSGGTDHRNVRLFLCPSETVADRWRTTYPNTPAVAVGCPKLDVYLLQPPPPPTDSIVAVSFHADYPNLCAEASGCWGYYDDALPTLAERFRLLGHGHPRLYPHLTYRWDLLKVEKTPEFSEVLDRASVFVVDNSSTAYEFAATGRPVILLNGPQYRRDVEHGLRFWSLIPGVTCDTPDELPGLIAEQLAHPEEYADLREKVSGQVYAFRDGRSSERAATAIMEVAGG